VIAELPGFWGPPTATVDWCEANYEHSFYVCEMFNAASSLAMVLAGIFGIGLHRRALEPRFLVAFFAVAIVGLGSIAFHATLRFELQMLDELPMLYSALVMVFILVENGPSRRFGWWFPALLAAHGVFLTCLAAFTRGNLQFYLFHTSFGSLELFALLSVYAIHRKSRNPTVRRMFRLGMTSYVTAIAFWFTDIQACSVLGSLPAYGLPNPQFHAVWHLLVSCGMYLLTLVIAYDRLERLGRHPELRIRLGILPAVFGVASPDGKVLAPAAGSTRRAMQLEGR
jgi:dihydroceramidase